ncbi:MAG: PDZ domain-containing protein [Nannocystaceae bacterium]|nr:PDZ domain-containing protein [bacterium]
MSPRIVLLAALFSTGCGSESVSSNEAPQPVARADAGPVAAPSAPESPGLREALRRGIAPPVSDDGTYRVDPFVAAFLYERLHADLAPLRRVDADGPRPAGYLVGALQAGDVLGDLGLREGDVVEALNGIAVTNAEQLELALDAAENRLTITVFREDLSFTNSYRFDGGLAWRDVIAGEPAEPPEPEPEPEPEPASEPEPEPTTPRSQRPAARPTRPTPTKPSGSARPAEPRASSQIRCTGASSCTITKRRFDDLRASPGALESGVDIVPAIRNDIFSGYKLTRVSSGSPIAALGFRAGDKITHVNGRDLTKDSQAMALYWSLGSSRVFKVRYERGGRKRVKTIRVV